MQSTISGPSTGLPFASVPRPAVPRRATRGDLARLLELEQLCFEEERRDSPATWRTSLGHERHEVWLIESTDGSVVASMILRPRRRVLALFSLACHPDFRGQGLGRTLLALALRRTRELGLTETVLEVAADQPDLLAWYQRHGFQTRRHLPDYYHPGHHAWRMHRPLGDYE